MKALEYYSEENRRGRFMKHVRPEVYDLAQRGNVTLKEYEALRLNSYEARLLRQFMATGDLAKLVVKYILPNCAVKEYDRYEFGSTYDEAAIGEFLPELCRRVIQ